MCPVSTPRFRPSGAVVNRIISSSGVKLSRIKRRQSVHEDFGGAAPAGNRQGGKPIEGSGAGERLASKVRVGKLDQTES